MIHQVYGIFDDGIFLSDIPIFQDNVDATKEFCKKHNYEYKLWDLKDCEKLIQEDYSEYQDLWNDFRYAIQRADFIRYCILHKYGGIYIDCDIRPMKDLQEIFQARQYFVYWADDEKRKPYNAIMGSQKGNNLFLDIMKQSKHDFYEKRNIKSYDTWVGRFIFQTTGHNMLDRVMRKNNIDKDKFFHDVLYIKNIDKGYDVGDVNTALFYDANASLWYDNLI